VYGREVDGKTLTFGHEGILFRSSFIMYDKGTKSLWVHTTGQAIKGPMKGKQLEFLPSTVTTWKRWREEHPKTKVLTGRKARGFMGSFRLEKSLGRYGLSLGQGDEVKLYPFKVLARRRVVNDEFDGKKIVVVYDSEGLAAAAFLRGKHVFSFEDGGMVDEKGREWDLFHGTRGEERLERLPATPWLVRRWLDHYPDSPIFR